MRNVLFLSAIWIFISVISLKADDNMKAFPPPENGQLRYVLQLPSLDTESNCKVELIVGKIVEIDKANQYFFSGQIKKETIAGWGFPRYIVETLGPMAGTLMAVDPDEPKIERFIHLGGEPYLVRYNSRLPIVVYVPEGVEVRYRIWSADTVMKTLKEG